VEVVELLFPDFGSVEEGEENGIDVIVLPVDPQGRPQTELLPHPMPAAMIIAISPEGRFGMRRLPGQQRWEQAKPFGLEHLVREVIRSSNLVGNHGPYDVIEPRPGSNRGLIFQPAEAG
jgi:hypothetical protein